MNSRLKFVIAGSSYLSVLLVSYLLPLFYPFLTPYCWLLIPVVASFLVGYVVGELYMAVKAVIAFLLIHITMITGLLGVPPFYDALAAYTRRFTAGGGPFLSTMGIILTYSIVNIMLGVTTSCLGIMVRNHIGELKKLLLANEA